MHLMQMETFAERGKLSTTQQKLHPDMQDAGRDEQAGVPAPSINSKSGLVAALNTTVEKRTTMRVVAMMVDLWLSAAMPLGSK